jgi:amino acid adenylation domain-containing protein
MDQLATKRQAQLPTQTEVDLAIDFKRTDAQSVVACVTDCFAALLYRYTSCPDIGLTLAADSGQTSVLFDGIRQSSFADLSRQSDFSIRQLLARQPAVRRIKIIPSSQVQGELISVPAAKESEQHVVLIISFENHIRLTLAASASAIDSRTVDQIGSHLRVLIEASVANPRLGIADVALLNNVERELVLTRWNKTSIPCSSESVPQLFARQASKDPNKTAVIIGDSSATYRQLNQWTDRLGRYLRGARVQHDTLVGSCFDNSMGAVISALGILKAGAAVVLLDPNHPTARLRAAIEDCHVSIVVTEKAYRDRFHFDNLKLIDLDEIQPQLSNESPSDLVFDSGPNSAAYVAYTSGSTGTPVGVMGIQRSILNGLNETLFVPQRGDEACCVCGSLNVGFQMLGLFLPLLSGVPLAIFSSAEYRDPTTLAKGIEKHRITNVVLPTPMFRQLLNLGKRVTTYLQTVRVIQVGGSVVTSDLVEMAATLLPHVELRKAWGTTEIGGMATKGVAVAGPSVGRPIANTKVYLLDDRMEPVPVGAKGEIYVAAAHLARGYVNQPDLTATRFLADPFDTSNKNRMFRTGDLGRWSWDGELEFLGRSDDQVKIRGYRVQLTELENVLAVHAGVFESAVVARPIGEELRLVAYVVPRPQTMPTAEQLRDHMSSRLPEYMIPSSFVFLDSFPMTESGKIDKPALPAPGPERPDVGTTYAAPAGPEESFLLDVWSELLGITDIGREDHFLSLGGDSLFAMQVVARIWEHYGLELPTMSLFDHPTIAELAAVIRKQNKN